MQTDDLGQQIKIGRPRVVTDLLTLGQRPRLGDSALLVGCLGVQAHEVSAMVDVLVDPARTLPIVIFSQAANDLSTLWATRVATRTEGIATVITLDQPAVEAFRKALGDLAVWGGAVRTYMPAPLDGPDDGWRHRYLPCGRLLASEASSLDRVVFSVAQLSTRRRLPPALVPFEPTPRPASAETAVLNEAWQFELELEREERAEVERELARTQGHLRRLEGRVREIGADAEIWQTVEPTADQPPDDLPTVTDAVIAAQAYLGDLLTIPEDAAQQLEGIDTAPNAYAWANTTWRGLQALAAFVAAQRERFSGDFYAFCKAGQGGWPATKKKLAMVESETVRGNTKLRTARVFSVNEEVDASGRMYMESHLKISEGGGDLAPRVYFYDDTRGRTGLVHVGFIGPHHLVPNTTA